MYFVDAIRDMKHFRRSWPKHDTTTQSTNEKTARVTFIGRKGGEGGKRRVVKNFDNFTLENGTPYKRFNSYKLLQLVLLCFYTKLCMLIRY